MTRTCDLEKSIKYANDKNLRRVRERLLRAARKVMDNAYAPFSNFKVEQPS